MKSRLVIIIALSVLVISLFAACVPAATSSSSYTPPPTDYQQVKNFIEGAQSRYAEGLDCGGRNYAPEIGISSTDFLRLKVRDANTIIFQGKSYSYKTASDNAELRYPDISIGDYTITYRDAAPGVTSSGGGSSTQVRAYTGKTLIGEFTYHEIGYIIINDSVNLEKFNIGDIVFLFIYYKPDCNSNARLWLVLTPQQAQQTLDSGTNVEVSIDWVDFIKFNDITYLKEVQKTPVSISEDNLVPYGEIKFKVADIVTDPNYQLKNGDSALLPKDTPIYLIKGYSPDFRLIAKTDQGLAIYESDTNPNAKKGGDLLDIGGKVNYIGINNSVDGTTELASIKDPIQVNDLVQMILDAPVDQQTPVTGSEQYFLEFYLSDGTSVNHSYWLDTGVLSRGIQLPQEFGQVISHALEYNSESN